ncbi:MAG: hypothetical protein Q4E57_03730 [Eubacteriales bacterium]|nr:hypothetical protein [Eubacteriales bacterium]
MSSGGSSVFGTKTVYGGMLGGGEKARIDPKMNLRFEFMLTEPADEERLNAAIEAALQVCPYMGYSMEKREDGLYFAPNERPLRAIPLKEEPQTYDCEADGHHLTHVLFEGRKLVIGVSHALTDGQGIKWFADALFRSYCGAHESLYEGKDAEDYAADLMREKLPVSAEYVFENPVQGSFFRLPEAGLRKFFMVNILESVVLGRKREFGYSLAADRASVKKLCREWGCSTTILFYLFMTEAIRRVHPDNQKPITLRMPVNTRQILNVPNTFQNASMPQAAFSVDPGVLKDGFGETAKAELRKMSESRKKQLTYDAMAFATNYFRRNLAKGEPKETGANRGADLMSTLDTTIFISGLGEVVPEAASGCVEKISMAANGGMPFMMYLLESGGRIFLSIYQNFENPCYVEALKQVIAEYTAVYRTVRTVV